MSKSHSYKTYMLFGSLSLIIIPLIAVALWTVLLFTQVIRTNINSSNKKTIIALSGRIQDFLSNSDEILANISFILERDDLYSKNNIEEYLALITWQYHFVEKIEITDSEGIILWQSPADSRLKGISRKGESNWESIQNQNSLYWSESFISLSNNTPGLLFGSRIGPYTVMSYLNLEIIHKFASYLQAIGNTSSQLRITDRNGVFLFHPDSSRVLNREYQTRFQELKNGNQDFISGTIRDDGKLWLITGQRLQSPEWYIWDMEPYDDVFRPVFYFNLGFIIILIVALILSFPIAWLRTGNLLKELEGFSANTLRASRGEFSPVDNSGIRFLELQSLNNSYNNMITSIKNREEILKEKERAFREILEKIQLWSFTVDRNGNLSFINTYFIRESSYTKQELLQAPARDCPLFPRNSPLAEFLADISVSGSLAAIESPVITRDGKLHTVVWTGTRTYDKDGEQEGFSFIGTDITTRINQQKIIEESLSEKNILLQEIHHRVKNNLQIIISLLALQSEKIENTEAAEYLDVAQNRIRSIALVHEHIYQSSNFSKISLNDYVYNLSQYISTTGNGNYIKIENHMDKVSVELQDAILCGLIVNEAFTNIQKYAFPAQWIKRGEAETVSLYLTLNPDNRFCLSIKDNGIGLPPDFDVNDETSLGCTIMQQLGSQLGGAVHIFSDKGTTVSLEV